MAETTRLELLLYPNDDEYVGKLILPKELPGLTSKKTQHADIATIIILDRSSSMDEQVERFVNTILPNIFQTLNYPPDEQIYLITFDTITELINVNVSQLSDMQIFCRGCTQMAPAVAELGRLILQELGDKYEAYRILTISDGEVGDSSKTQENASNVAKGLKDKMINSQAVRLFTSDWQPDTRALSSILQVNNVNNVTLLDVKTELSDADLVEVISALFLDDGMEQKITLSADDAVLKKSPWTTEYTDKLTVLPGENIFWVKTIPGALRIEEIDVTVSIQPELDLDTYSQLFKSKIQHYMTQLRILKVVNTKDAAETIENMVGYFHERESKIINKEKDVKLLLGNSSLRSRYEYLKELISRRSKTYSMAMSQIANDEKISKLNAAQQADYLRSVDNTRNSRGLARRALNQGIDFDEKIRKEVAEMNDHIDELKDVDDKDHTVSFFSRETTLGGIRAVCELARDGMLEELEGNDIFLMINIVGVGCLGPIGDFPDPMTWRVGELHLGSYVSLSDVLLSALNQCELKTPGTERLITNVIPVFDDPRIPKFLRKHAPSLLEYISSIGMRRVIAEVPMTLGYTLCAGVWKCAELVDENKSELHVRTFARLVTEYSRYVGGYFDHVLPHVKEQERGSNSYYIANNGITNMIAPIYKMYKSRNEEQIKHVPDILRALYAYEICQVIRRLCKLRIAWYLRNEQNPDQIARDILYNLLGVDLERNRTALAPMYELEPETVTHHNRPEINREYLADLSRSFSYVRYVTLLPDLFRAVADDRPDSIKDIPQLDENSIKSHLALGYDLETFHLYNIVQALLFPTKAARVDAETETMKILDLQHETLAAKMVSDYVWKQHHNQYLSELAKKKRAEQIGISTALVDSVLASTTPEAIVDLMRNGISRGKISFKITNQSSLGYADLKQKLVDTSLNVPLRAEAIAIFLLGRDRAGEPVWNNGGVNFVYNLKDFSRVFKLLGKEARWEEIHKEYKERGLHVYRELMNRHGHGNPKPSYWAFGYPTLEHYRNDIAEEEFAKYCREHSECCGVKKIVELLNLKL